jgi:hypothetical protein
MENYDFVLFRSVVFLVIISRPVRLSADVLLIRNVFSYFSLHLLETFLDSTEIYRDSIIILRRLTCKVPMIFFRFKKNGIISIYFSKNHRYKNARNSEFLVRADGRSDITSDRRNVASSCSSQLCGVHKSSVSTSHK